MIDLVFSTIYNINVTADQPISGLDAHYRVLHVEVPIIPGKVLLSQGVRKIKDKHHHFNKCNISGIMYDVNMTN